MTSPTEATTGGQDDAALRTLFADPARAEEFLRGLVGRPDLDLRRVVEICDTALHANPLLISAYRLAAQALPALNDPQALERLGARVRDAGRQHLIGTGKLDEGAAFFRQLASDIPDPCQVYATFFGQISAMTALYRSLAVPRPAGAPPRLLIALPVWGERYRQQFVRYGIPSLLAAGNLPALRQIRDVHFDICTTAQDADAFCQSPAFQKLAGLSRIQFTLFDPAILTSAEYARDTNLRYWIFGAFHHLSVERARALEGDIAFIAPDLVYSDGALTSYARFIDQGYRAVLITALRAQAERVMPILDGLRDDTAHTLAVAARKLVDINVQNVHHDHKKYVLTKGNSATPGTPSVVYFPHAHGFHVRCLHAHPIILSAATIKKDIAFDYQSIDANSLASFFPGAEDLARIKLIQDSDDGFLLDLAYAYSYATQAASMGKPFTPELFFQSGGNQFLPHHFWAFQQRIDFHGDDTIDTFGSYDLSPDGALTRRSIPIADRIELGDDEIAAWVEAHRPRSAA